MIGSFVVEEVGYQSFLLFNFNTHSFENVHCWGKSRRSGTSLMSTSGVCKIPSDGLVLPPTPTTYTSKDVGLGL